MTGAKALKESTIFRARAAYTCNMPKGKRTMNNLTQQDVLEYLYSEKHSKVAINRVARVMKHCNSLDVFSRMTQQQFLSTYNQLDKNHSKGPTTLRSYDLGTRTWKAFADAQAFVKGEKRDERIEHEKVSEERKSLEEAKAELQREREDIETMNTSFTVSELSAIVAFMRQNAIQAWDLRKLNAFSRETGIVWSREVVTV